VRVVLCAKLASGMVVAVSQLRWPPIIEQARRFVEAQPVPPDLRDTHYHLAGRQLVPNNRNAYKRLSEITAPLRREGAFPDFAEDVRWIDRPFQFDDPDEALQWLRENYRIDHTIGQDVSVYLVVEKNGMVPRLRYWFDQLALPMVGLRGISSATLENKVNRDIARQGRSAVALYFGDFDPTGVFIPEDFAKHTRFDKLLRLGVNEDQVDAYGLLESITPQTDKDSRTPAFVRKYGRVRQVEMNAMDFDTVRSLYQQAIDLFWNPDAYQAALDREAEEREQLP
jgi:hypothetical protein